MATKTEELRPEGQDKQLIEMAWDPITRIVGSLGTGHFNIAVMR